MSDQQEKRLRHVLVPAWYFPPFAGVNGLRASKFCKYLRDHEWEATVLAADERCYGKRVVPETPREIRELEVVRVPGFPVPGSPLLGKLVFFFAIFWIAMRHRGRWDAVLMGGGPFYPFLTAPLLALFLRIPVILDFRDSWSVGAPGEGGVASGPSRWVRHFVEFVGIRYAAAVTFATDPLRVQYEAAHPAGRDRYSTIPNGYDPEDYEGISPRRVGEGLTLVMTGKFLYYTPEAARYLAAAMRDVPDLTFLYVGDEGERIRELFRAEGIERQLVIRGFMSREELLPFIAGADYAMLSNNVPNGMGTKVFDYLVLGKPVLCFVPVDSVITRRFGDLSSFVIREAPHTAESVADGVRALLALKPEEAAGALDGFDRREGAARLAAILDHLGTA